MVPICQSQRSGDAKRICEIFTQKSRIPTMTKRETFMLLGLTRFMARFQSKKCAMQHFEGIFINSPFFETFPHQKEQSWCILPRSRHRYWNRTGRYKRPRHCTSINDTSVCVDPTAPMAHGDPRSEERIHPIEVKIGWSFANLLPNPQMPNLGENAMRPVIQ